MEFMNAYKRLEKLCSDMYGTAHGISAYIDDVQEDTLSSVPLSIKKYTGDTAAIFEAMTQTNADAAPVYEDDRIYPNDTMGSMFSAMMQIQERDIVSFKNYFTENFENVKDSLNAYKYVICTFVNGTCILGGQVADLHG